MKPGKMLPFIMKELVKKPATIKYPYTKAEMPDKFRGKLEFDESKCIGCRMCMRDCPANAISIKKVGDKQFKAEVYLDQCIYCAQCVDSCPKAALKYTGNFELANFNRENLRVKI